MDKILDALIANAAANIAVLVLIFVVGLLYHLFQQQRADRKEEVAKIAQALNALADTLQKLQLDFASRGGSRQ